MWEHIGGGNGEGEPSFRQNTWVTASSPAWCGGGRGEQVEVELARCVSAVGLAAY